MHALGMIHEQQRPDRDDYITIHLENVITGKEHNFQKYLRAEMYGQPYEYMSVMHYFGTAFSSNDEITMEAADPAYQDEMGMATDLSEGDKAALIAAYNCQKK